MIPAFCHARESGHPGAQRSDAALGRSHSRGEDTRANLADIHQLTQRGSIGVDISARKPGRVDRGRSVRGVIVIRFAR
jgi:hypothetical protein